MAASSMAASSSSQNRSVEFEDPVTIDLENVMETGQEFPDWNPAKESLTEYLERTQGKYLPEEEEDPNDSWDLLQDSYSLASWENLTRLILEADNRDLQKRTIRAAMRLAATQA